MAALGAQPQREARVVHDGKIATAAGVSAGIDLGLWLAGQIAGAETAQAIQLAIEYDPQPPYDGGRWGTASSAVKREAAALFAREAKDLAAREPGRVAREAAAVPQVLWRSALRRARGGRRRRLRARG